MSTCVGTFISPVFSYLDASSDDNATLDVPPVLLVTAPLLSIMLGERVDGGGLRVSVELLYGQNTVLHSNV